MNKNNELNMAFWTLALMCALILIASLCGCTKTIPQTIVRDSVRVVHSERVCTLNVTLPMQSAERVVRDTTSHLCIAYAESYAKVLPDGSLWHNLISTDRPVAVQVVQNTDTIFRDKAQTITKIEKVAAPLSRWQTFRLRTWWWLMGALAALAVYKWRKVIWDLIGKMILK